MKKVLLWGMGKDFVQHRYIIKYFEMLGKFSVVGVTSSTTVYEEFYGYKYIRKNNINNVEFNYIVVMAEGEGYKEILKEAFSLGIAEENIFNYRVLSIPNFDIDKYINLKKNIPSIFSNNCLGGLIYHSLGLEFTSPLINMFESPVDYLKLLKNTKNI